MDTDMFDSFVPSLEEYYVEECAPSCADMGGYDWWFEPGGPWAEPEEGTIDYAALDAEIEYREFQYNNY